MTYAVLKQRILQENTKMTCMKMDLFSPKYPHQSHQRSGNAYRPHIICYTAKIEPKRITTGASGEVVRYDDKFSIMYTDILMDIAREKYLH